LVVNVLVIFSSLCPAEKLLGWDHFTLSQQNSNGHTELRRHHCQRSLDFFFLAGLAALRGTTTTKGAVDVRSIVDYFI